MDQNEVRQYFDFHNSNMKSLKIGYNEMRNQIKQFYRKTDENTNLVYSLNDSDPVKIKLREKELTFSRILSGIQVSWAEESLKRLLYEKDLLNNNQRIYILKKPLIQKWLETFKIVYCIAYDLVPNDDDTCSEVILRNERRNLGAELINQYFILRKVITDHLTPNFEIRNKVQHGEWIYAFKPPISQEYSQTWTDRINDENIITSTSRSTIVNAVYNLIVDLGRFKSNSFALDSISTPFEYFFEKYYKKIEFEVDKINNANLEDYINEMVQRETRGIAYRTRQ